MSRVTDAFSKRKAFIQFITAGDPNLAVTEAAVRAAAANGADLIELGIPFSDPTAEGVVIQEASERALAAGMTTDKAFELVKKLRKDLDIPLVFMTYANVVYSQGIDAFAKKCQEAGLDGIILPDVPFEEKEEFAPAFQSRGMEWISMVAPTSKERVEMIAKDAKGFLYIVSSLGVTGERAVFANGLSEMVEHVKSVNPDLPCAIGFGISNPAQAKEMAQFADGVIIGSAVVRRIHEAGENAPEAVGEFTRQVREAIDQ
jgi:tryptophan synthase alpha chain